MYVYEYMLVPKTKFQWVRSMLYVLLVNRLLSIKENWQGSKKEKNEREKERTYRVVLYNCL
jgi:hypothetical protein